MAFPSIIDCKSCGTFAFGAFGGAATFIAVSRTSCIIKIEAFLRVCSATWWKNPQQYTFVSIHFIIYIYLHWCTFTTLNSKLKANAYTTYSCIPHQWQHMNHHTRDTPWHQHHIHTPNSWKGSQDTACQWDNTLRCMLCRYAVLHLHYRHCSLRYILKHICFSISIMHMITFILFLKAHPFFSSKSDLVLWFIVQAPCHWSVTLFSRDLKIGMMMPYDNTQLFDRRLSQLSSAILDFGGHLGFSDPEKTVFTKIAVIS